MVFECDVRGGSFDADLTNSTAFSNVSLWDAEKNCYLLDNLFILPCELTSLTFRVTELEVTNPQDSREHTEYPKRERLRYIQNLQEIPLLQHAIQTSTGLISIDKSISTQYSTI